jgi:hypothetical protein
MCRSIQKIYPIVNDTDKHLYLEEDRVDCIKWCKILGKTFLITLIVFCLCIIGGLIASMAKVKPFVSSTFWILTGFLCLVGGDICFIYISTGIFYSQIEYQYDNERDVFTITKIDKDLLTNSAKIIETKIENPFKPKFFLRIRKKYKTLYILYDNDDIFMDSYIDESFSGIWDSRKDNVMILLEWRKINEPVQQVEIPESGDFNIFPVKVRQEIVKLLKN